MRGKGDLSRAATSATKLVSAYLRTRGNGRSGAGNGAGEAGPGMTAADPDEDMIAVARKLAQPGLPLTLPLPVVVAARMVLVTAGHDAASVDTALGEIYGKPYVPSGAVAAACPDACVSHPSCLLYGCRLAKLDELVALMKQRLPSRHQ